LGLMGQEEYLKAKRKIEKIFKKIWFIHFNYMI
jgi:hypothetical protein